ncbi:hypothetical protein [Naumannella huperziae]
MRPQLPPERDLPGADRMLTAILAGDAEAEAADELARRRRRRITVAAAIAACLALIGVAVGVLAFPRQPPVADPLPAPTTAQLPAPTEGQLPSGTPTPSASPSPVEPAPTASPSRVPAPSPGATDDAGSTETPPPPPANAGVTRYNAPFGQPVRGDQVAVTMEQMGQDEQAGETSFTIIVRIEAIGDQDVTLSADSWSVNTTDRLGVGTVSGFGIVERTLRPGEVTTGSVSFDAQVDQVHAVHFDDSRGNKFSWAYGPQALTDLDDLDFSTVDGAARIAFVNGQRETAGESDVADAVVTVCATDERSLSYGYSDFSFGTASGERLPAGSGLPDRGASIANQPGNDIPLMPDSMELGPGDCYLGWVFVKSRDEVTELVYRSRNGGSIRFPIEG